MCINKTILNANDIFSTAKCKVISKAFMEAVKSTSKLLQELPDIDIVFYHNPNAVISETGIGGNTDTQHVIMIPLDAYFDFSEHELMLTICHELHHAVRMSRLGDTNSLLKKVISEGLADQFENEIDPNHHPITYRKDMVDIDITQGLDDLMEVVRLKGGEYDYYEWFFGYGKYPNWFGYTLGNYIIEAYCRHNNTTPSTLVYTPAEKFIPFLEEEMLRNNQT